MQAPDIGTTVLFVDDEPAIIDALGAALELQGFTVVAAHRGADALSLVDDRPPDVVVLDVGLPDASGIDICATIRRSSPVPILMISGRASEGEVVGALEAGADDYLVKPFGIAELVARIRAALRRASPPEPVEAFVQAGPVTLAPGLRRAWVRGTAVELPDKEFVVLETLVRNHGRVVTRANIAREVSGGDAEMSSKALGAMVRRLREKLGDDAGSIVTVRGVGFRFEPPS